MIYLAQIAHIGRLVEHGLSDHIVITFADDGPPDCLDYALALQPVFKNDTARLLVGDWLFIGNENYRISAVGAHAQDALFELGHLTLIFDNAATARHAGTVHLDGMTPTVSLLHGDLTLREAAI